MRNPYAKPYRVLGVTDAQWQAGLDAVRAYLQNHPELQEVPDATVRALHPALANEQVWNEFKRELGAA